jgi:hypothetical protein
MGTYSQDQEVCKAKTFLAPYRKIQYVAINKLNPFWRDILLNLSEMLSKKDEEENNIINILSQPIWLNFNIKRNGIIFLLLTNIGIMVSFKTFLAPYRKIQYVAIGPLLHSYL